MKTSNGKMVKNVDGTYQTLFASFPDIQKKMSYQTPDGVRRTYEYNIVLYILIILILHTWRRS